MGVPSGGFGGNRGREGGLNHLKEGDPRRGLHPAPLDEVCCVNP